MDQRPLSPAELHAIDAYWRAANYLSVGQIYLLDNPLLRQPLTPEAHQAPPAGTLGHDAGAQFHLRAPQPHYQAGRPRRDLHRRAGPRRARGGREYLSGRDVQRAVSRGVAGSRRAPAAVQAVLLPGRHSEPCGAGDARLHPRGRRAGLLADPRVRRRVRQSGPDRGVRGRRWGGRDRAAGHGVALEQVPQPGHRRRGAADPAPQRLQDRQPDRPCPDQRPGAGEPLSGLRVPSLPGRGLRARGGAPGDGRGDGCRPGGDPHDPDERALERRSHAPPVADDHPAHAQGMDRAQDGGRQEDGRLVALAPGAAGRPGNEARACQAARAVDEELSTGGALRRGRRPDPGAGRARPRGRPANGGQSPRQRRRPARGSGAAGLSGLRRRRSGTGNRDRGGHASARRFPPGRDAAEPRAAELPGVRPGRDRLQPAGRAVRGHRAHLAGRPDSRTISS